MSPKNDEQFEESSIGEEHGFFFVAFAHSDVIVSPAYVQFREDLRVAELVDDFRDERYGVTVFDCHRVELALVLNRS